MKVLLTGATGFIGRHVLAELLRQNVEVAVTGRTPPSGYSGEFIHSDLLEPGACKHVAKQSRATHLLHLAWYAEHGLYWSSTLNLRWLDASLQLFDAFCKNGGKRILGIGTCAEYDWATGYLREDDSLINPSTLYGAAKDATRRLAYHVCNSQGVPFVWCRIFFPYGPGEDERRLIPSLIRVFKRASPPFGINGHAYRDMLHVEDVSRALTKLLFSNSTGVYNIASGQPTLLSDVVSILAESAGKDPGIVLNLATARPNDPPLLIGDNNKLLATGWTMQKSLVEYLRDIMNV